MQERYAAYTRSEVDERKKRLAIRVRSVEAHTDSHYRRGLVASLKQAETGKPATILQDDLAVFLPRLASVEIEQFLLEGSSVDGLRLNRILKELVAAGKVIQYEDDGVTIYKMAE